MSSKESITIIKPSPKLSLPDLKEAWNYRELLFTFVKRDLTVRYRQTIIGGIWAVIQPLTTMVIFSFFFGYLAQISGDGVPYPVFSYSGLVLWIYFANALSAASGSVVAAAGLFTKVYFPRLIVPIAASMTGILDYFVALTILFGLMIFYQITPPIIIIFLPFLVLLTWLLATGIGFWLSAINVRYRDVGFIMPFFIQLMMYVTPVIYPVSIAPNFKHILALNPMTGIIETHRAIILGIRDINYTSLIFSVVITLIIFITGAIYFRSVERKFADIV
ncbi:MAG: ABC transporter permease [Candidatus Microgenomates bacterium]